MFVDTYSALMDSFWLSEDIDSLYVLVPILVGLPVHGSLYLRRSEEERYRVNRSFWIVDRWIFTNNEMTDGRT
jgi:hypothetical protein